MNIRIAIIVWSALCGLAMAQDNRIDGLRPDAPALAAPGQYDVGVRTITLTHGDQPDVLGAPGAMQDRPLTTEIWYPADLAGGEPGGDYADVVLVDGVTRYTLQGQAVRDAQPVKAGPFPLVLISHGYPGNRFLVSHLGENLASKGYVVAAIDHFESTYDNQFGFGSTLVNRAQDQLFVLDAIAELSTTEGEFLQGLADANNTAIIGYSMGGYGALISAGAGVTEASTGFGFAPPNGALSAVQAGTGNYAALLDPRLQAIVAIGPWGRQAGFWDASGLAGIDIPTFIMGGSLDEVSDYQNGIRLIFEEAVNADRYLLTFANAGHNAGAPIPPPAEATGAAFEHYGDFVWDNVRMNNIAQHFITAFLGKTLKADDTMAGYLDLPPGPAADPYGDKQWMGFGPRTARGLQLEHLPAL